LVKVPLLASNCGTLMKCTKGVEGNSGGNVSYLREKIGKGEGSWGRETSTAFTPKTATTEVVLGGHWKEGCKGGGFKQ